MIHSHSCYLPPFLIVQNIVQSFNLIINYTRYILNFCIFRCSKLVALLWFCAMFHIPFLHFSYLFLPLFYCLFMCATKKRYWLNSILRNFLLFTYFNVVKVIWFTYCNFLLKVFLCQLFLLHFGHFIYRVVPECIANILGYILVHIYDDIFEFLFLMQMKHLLLKRTNANINNTILAILFSTKNDVTKISIKKDIVKLLCITYHNRCSAANSYIWLIISFLFILTKAFLFSIISLASSAQTLWANSNSFFVIIPFPKHLIIHLHLKPWYYYLYQRHTQCLKQIIIIWSSIF